MLPGRQKLETDFLAPYPKSGGLYSMLAIAVNSNAVTIFIYLSTGFTHMLALTECILVAVPRVTCEGAVTRI